MTRWIHQTTFSDKEKGTVGNCTQAAIAAYMGVSRSEVPDFANDPKYEDAGDFWAGIHKWFEDRGYCLCMMSKTWGFGGLYLVGGVSPRNPDVRHMVVYESGQLKHDPHPDGTGIVGDPIHVWVAIPIDPKILTSKE